MSSFQAKTEELEGLMFIEDLDNVGLTETCWNGEIGDIWLSLYVSSTERVRNNRLQGGVVLLYILRTA